MKQEVLLNGMKAALAEARLAVNMGEFPYGAVVINPDGEIVSRAQDMVLRRGDATSHAEMEAVRAAVVKLGPELSGCALVSNVEPCAMCATAAWWAKISIIAYGLSQVKLFAVRPDSMEEPGLSLEEAFYPFKRRVEIVPDLLHAESIALWKKL